MCNGENCSRKKRCYRYGTSFLSYQSYFMNSPVFITKDDTESCDYFIDKELYLKNTKS